MIIPILRINDWWNQVGQNASIMLACCILAIPFLAAIDMLDKMQEESDDDAG